MPALPRLMPGAGQGGGSSLRSSKETPSIARALRSDVVPRHPFNIGPLVPNSSASDPIEGERGRHDEEFRNMGSGAEVGLQRGDQMLPSAARQAPDPWRCSNRSGNPSERVRQKPPAGIPQVRPLL